MSAVDGPGAPAGPPQSSPGLLPAVGKLSAVVLAVVAIAVLLHATGVVIVVLAIVAIVMLHELGQLATAKWSGMKVTEYFFGFGPRLWSVVRGETTYGVKAIPAGGYVKIVGMTMLEDVAEEDEPRSYRQATFPRRVLVASAGSIVHFILAFALLWSVFAFLGTPLASAPTISSLLTIDGRPSPATVSGLQPGDAFVSVDGHPTPTFDALTAVISPAAGKPLAVVVNRHGRLVHLVVTPASETADVCSAGKLVHHVKGEIGVELLVTKEVTFNPAVSVPKAADDFGSLVSAAFAGLGDFFSLSGLHAFGHQVTSAGSSPSQPAPCAGAATSGGSSSGSGSGGSSNGQIVSILGAVQLGSQLYSLGFSSLFVFLAFLNLFIGIVNLFPMLPLDGGHVAIAVYERIRSRRGKVYHADVAKLLPFAYIFLAFIVIIGIGALYSNILHPVHLSGG